MNNYDGESKRLVETSEWETRWCKVRMGWDKTIVEARDWLG